MSRASRKQRYENRVRAEGLRALQSGLIGPGQHGVINVYHDDWCATQNGGTQCNCNPIVGPVEPATKEEVIQAYVDEVCRLQRLREQKETGK